MKLRNVFIYLIICTILLSGCRRGGAGETASTDTLCNTALELYSAAMDTVSATKNYSMEVVYSRNFEAGTEVFHETRNQLLQFSDISGPNMAASVKEDVTIGTRTITYSETYSGGMSYLSFDGANLSGEVSSEVFLQRFVPVILLTPEYYKNTVCSQGSDGNVTIQFYNPNKLEAWAASADAVPVDATGRVILSQDGTILESHSYISYIENGITITLNVSAIPNFAPVTVTKPQNTESFVQVDSVYAARILEETCSYLLQCDDVVFSGIESAHSDAFEEERIKTVNIKMSGSNEALNATIDTNLKQIDNSLGGSTTELNQKETFDNQVYTVIGDDKQAISDASVSSETMQTYCRDIFVEDIPLAKNIVSAEMTQSESALQLTFTVSEDMASVLRKKASQILSGDETFFDSISGEHATQSLRCTMTLNSQTGLLSSVNTDYTGSFTIDDAVYVINLQIVQVYALAGISEIAEVTPSTNNVQ